MWGIVAGNLKPHNVPPPLVPLINPNQWQSGINFPKPCLKGNGGGMGLDFSALDSS